MLKSILSIMMCKCFSQSCLCYFDCSIKWIPSNQVILSVYRITNAYLFSAFFVKLIVLTQNDIKSFTLYCSFQNESIIFLIRIGIKIFTSSVKFVIFLSSSNYGFFLLKKICNDVFMDLIYNYLF